MDVADEVDHEVLPTYCSLLVIPCFVSKVSRGLNAALTPLLIVANFEEDPSSALDVLASMGMIVWC